MTFPRCILDVVCLYHIPEIRYSGINILFYLVLTSVHTSRQSITFTIKTDDGPVRLTSTLNSSEVYTRRKLEEIIVVVVGSVCFLCISVTEIGVAKGDGVGGVFV